MKGMITCLATVPLSLQEEEPFIQSLIMVSKLPNTPPKGHNDDFY